MKTIKDIEAAQNRIASAMSDKGVRNPRPNIEIDFGDRYKLWLHADSLIGGQECCYFYADELDELFEKADALIADLPSPEEKAAHDYMVSLARIADLGLELGIDDEFVAPIRNAKEGLAQTLLAAPNEAIAAPATLTRGLLETKDDRPAVKLDGDERYA